MDFSEMNIRNNFKNSLLPFIEWSIEWSIDYSQLSLFNFRLNFENKFF